MLYQNKIVYPIGYNIILAPKCALFINGLMHTSVQDAARDYLCAPGRIIIQWCTTVQSFTTKIYLRWWNLDHLKNIT